MSRASLGPPQSELLQDVIWGTRWAAHIPSPHLYLCFVYISREHCSLQPSTQRGCAGQCRITTLNSPSLHVTTDSPSIRESPSGPCSRSKSGSYLLHLAHATQGLSLAARRDPSHVPPGNGGQAKQTDFGEFRRALASSLPLLRASRTDNHNCKRRKTLHRYTKDSWASPRERRMRATGETCPSRARGGARAGGGAKMAARVRAGGGGGRGAAGRWPRPLLLPVCAGRRQRRSPQHGGGGGGAQLRARAGGRAGQGGARRGFRARGHVHGVLWRGTDAGTQSGPSAWNQASRVGGGGLEERGLGPPSRPGGRKVLRWRRGSPGSGALQGKGPGRGGPGGGPRAGRPEGVGEQGCAVGKGDECCRNQRVREDLGRKGGVGKMESLWTPQARRGASRRGLDRGSRRKGTRKGWPRIDGTQGKGRGSSGGEGEGGGS